MKKLVKLLPFYWVSLIVIILDQVSKYVVKSSIEPGQIIKLSPKLIWLTSIQNTGAAFSFSFGNPLINRILFIIISFIAVTFIIYLSIKSKNRLEIFSFALILGGALGNLVDRIFIGSVTDFIWCDFPDIIMTRWPVFNVADSSIVIAIILMIASILFQKERHEEKE
ncbi:MAG: signal peptidase II [Candidatus Cloacimonadota bacterium]|nr:signal peptidase II [Candidatus Cloacimonadota bacterium]